MKKPVEKKSMMKKKTGFDPKKSEAAPFSRENLLQMGKGKGKKGKPLTVKTATNKKLRHGDKSDIY